MPDLSQLMTELVWSELQTSFYPSWKSAKERTQERIYSLDLLSTSLSMMQPFPFLYVILYMSSLLGEHQSFCIAKEGSCLKSSLEKSEHHKKQSYTII